MTSSEVSSSRNVDLYFHSCCVCSRCRYCYLGWQSAWGVNVYMFIKRVPYSTEEAWNWEQIRTFPSHMLAVFVKIRFSAGLWQRIAMPYGAVEFSRVVVVLVYSLPM